MPPAPAFEAGDAFFDDTLHDWVFWLTPADGVVVEVMPPLGMLEEEIGDDVEAHDYTFWLTPGDVVVVEEMPPIAELAEAVEDAEVAEAGWVFWLTPGDVEDFLPLAEWGEITADRENESDPGWLRGAIEDLVMDFQALPVLVEAGVEFDDTLYQWAAWPLAGDVLPEDFLPLGELVESEIAFDDSLFNWTTGPNMLAGLPGFTIGLVRVTSTVRGMVVTIGLRAAKVTTKYKGVRDGTTD